jgi:superfamily II DNA or RNA helicase
MNSLRPYQSDAINAALAAFEQHQSALVVMPTGTGKTVVFAHVAEYFRQHGHVLILAHREELLQQAQEKIAQWTRLSTEIEKAK